MDEKLHPFQVMILIYMIQSGISLFSLPRVAAENFGYNGWLSILFLTLPVFFNLYLISKVDKLGNGRSIFEILETRIHKVILYPIYISLCVVWSVMAILVAKRFIMLLKMLFFPNISMFPLLCMSLLLCFLLLKRGIYQIGKTTVVIFYLTIWTVVLLLFHVKEFELSRLTPFIFKGDLHVYEGVIGIYTAFLGYELVILLLPFIDRSKGWFRAVYAGNMITTLIYVFTALIAFGFFSLVQLIDDMYPVLTMLEYIKFPFIERIENLIFTLFALKVLITTVMYYWASIQTLERVLPKVRVEVLIILVFTLSIAVQLIPQMTSDVDYWLKILSLSFVGIGFALPLLTLVVLGINFLKEKETSL